MSASLYLEPPPRALFKFPPDQAPPAIPPPSDQSTFASPFAISAETYNALLSPAVPITIAVAYATTVSFVNAYNRKHGNKPWPISKTRAFKAFVILHNVFLAVYSFITCLAMTRALKRTLPALNSNYDIVQAVDALCKMHGPRGLGDAVTFNPAAGAWGVKNPLIQLGELGTPDSTDVGRLWNEGLAFWGWWFYLSKFYEVLDTFIIQAKGKRSSTLQTYHHAGAMLCMWAGIRYMSPPIWMFVTINSGIHALMYTYYTISALRIPVPQALKRTLTTMQITQFVVGATFAGLHLFVAYTVPISTPYTITKSMTAAASAISSAASSAFSGAVTDAAASVSFGGYLKKLAFRAAGEEGLAENVAGQMPAVAEEAKRVIEHFTQETNFRVEYQKISCIDTTGQSFAIWLNLMYLFPLTALFVRFFVKSYIKRTSTMTARSTTHGTLAKATQDAAHGVDREIDSLGRGIEETMENLTTKLKYVKDEDEKERLKREVLKDLSQYKSKAAKLNGSHTLNSSAAKEEARKEIEQDAEDAKRALEERIKQALAEDMAKSRATNQDRSANGSA